MTRDRPKNKWNHRDPEIDRLHTIDPSESIAKWEDDDDELGDRESEWEHDRRETPELVARDEDTDRRDLIEEPSDEIRFGFSLEDRVDIPKHRSIDEEGRYDECKGWEFHSFWVIILMLSEVLFFCKKWWFLYSGRDFSR